MRSTRLALVILLGLSAGACSGDTDSSVDSRPNQEESGEKIFTDEDFGITFTYPTSLTEGTVGGPSEQVGRDPDAEAILFLDDDNALFVSKYVNASPLTRDVAEVVPVFDKGLSESFGGDVTGRAVEIDGLPGIRYDDLELPGTADGRSRLLFLFDGRDQYSLNCQSFPARRHELDSACDGVFATLQKKGG